MPRYPEDMGSSVPEFADTPDLGLLISRILQHLDERLLAFQLLSSKNEYLQASQTFPDVAMEYFCVLSKNPPSSHQWLWLLVVTRLAQISTRLIQQRKQLSPFMDIHISSAAAILGLLVQQVARHCEMLLEALDMSFIISNETARSSFLAAVKVSVGLCMPEQTYLKHGSLVVSVVLAISRYSVEFSPENDVHFQEFKVSLLPVLVEIAKAAFLSGVPSAVLPLVFPDENSSSALVSETFLPSIILDPRVTLPLITNYYRYYAFCLVTSASEGNQIDDVLAKKADLFLRVLLGLPHLQLVNYMAETASVDGASAVGETMMVSGVEREEISFFFLLNYLLRIRSLASFVDPDAYFIKERRFFIASFNKRCGAELDFSASASLSRTGSVVSMTRVPDLTSVNYPLASVTLSSILSDGSYKEKVRLVADFFNLTSETGGAGSVRRLIQNFDMSGMHHRTNHFSLSSHDVVHIFNRIDSQQYPGKVAYVKALDMIVRLLQLVSLKHFHLTFAHSLRPAEFLSLYFKTNYLLRDILLVKDLLLLEDNDVLRISYRPVSSEADFISRQLCILENTRLLKSDVQKLI